MHGDRLGGDGGYTREAFTDARPQQGMDCAAREMYIPAELKQMTRNIEELQEAMTALGGRLSPLMNKNMVNAPRAEESKTDALPELAQMLHRNNVALAGVNRHISDILNQLEL